MDVGDYAIDTDDDEPDLAVVIGCPERSIDEITVGSGDAQRTVAEDNPEYDPTEPVVRVAFVESGLNQDWPAWTEADPADLSEGVQDHDVKCYYFPESRLMTVTDEQAAAMLAERTVDMDALQRRLEDADWDIETRADGSMVVEKMSEQYCIYPTGTVEGDGQIRAPLKNIVTEYAE